MVCESKNKIVKMCIKSSCPNPSLFCDKKDCPSCKEEHKKCIQISLEAVTDGINKHLPIKGYILERVEAIEGNFFNALKETSSSLEEEIRFAGLGDKEKRVIEEIYEKGHAKWLKGKEAADFYQNVEEYEENKPSMDSIRSILN